MSKLSILPLLFFLATPAFAKSHPLPCNDLWSAVTDTLGNPGHYKIGEYDGLSVLFIPARGFIHIMVSVTATDLVSI